MGLAFQHWAAVNVLGVTDDEVCRKIEGSMTQDRGIDYFHVNDEAETVEIMQTKFYEKRDTGASREDLRSFAMTVQILNEGSGGSEFFKTCQNHYKKAINADFGIRLIFVMTGSLTEENKEEIRTCKKNIPNGVTFECWETKDLLGLIGNPASRTHTLKLYDKERFVSKGSDGEIRKMVATVKAEEVKKIYDKIGAPTLFSANPRDFLGPRGKITKRIIQTLKESPKRLWHYNNGISAVCKQFHYDEESNALKIENLKIVNGCQTVTTIGLCELPIDGDATLLFRLSEVDDKDFQKKISENTNEQNKVQHTDLNSDRDELKLLERKFAKYAPFFWERKRGQFETERRRGKISIKPYRGKRALYILTNVIAAKLKLAYKLEVPHESLQLGQEKIFDDNPIRKSSNIQPFPDIYKNADPLDFILPNIFYYYLGKIEKKPEVDKRVLKMTSLDIGKYYVIAVIGKIVRSMQSNEQDEINKQIVKAVTNQEHEIIEQLIDKLENLVYGVATCLEAVLDGEKKLSDYKSEELKAALREGVFGVLYRERERVTANTIGKTDLFEVELKQIFSPHTTRN